MLMQSDRAGPRKSKVTSYSLNIAGTAYAMLIKLGTDWLQVQIPPN